MTLADFLAALDEDPAPVKPSAADVLIVAAVMGWLPERRECDCGGVKKKLGL